MNSGNTGRTGIYSTIRVELGMKPTKLSDVIAMGTIVLGSAKKQHQDTESCVQKTGTPP